MEIHKYVKINFTRSAIVGAMTNVAPFVVECLFLYSRFCNLLTKLLRFIKRPLVYCILFLGTRILVLATKNEILEASWPQDFFLKVEPCYCYVQTDTATANIVSLGECYSFWIVLAVVCKWMKQLALMAIIIIENLQEFQWQYCDTHE